MNFQKIILVGNATMDAKKKRSQRGNVAFTTFSVGVRNSKKSTTFFPVIAFDTLSAFADRFIKSGTQVLVEGRIQTNGNSFNVIASRIELVFRGKFLHKDKCRHLLMKKGALQRSDTK